MFSCLFFFSNVQTTSIEGRQDPWIKIVRAPSLSRRPLRPGRACHIIFEALEGTKIVELEGRIVGFGQLACVSLSPSLTFRTIVRCERH